MPTSCCRAPSVVFRQDPVRKVRGSPCGSMVLLNSVCHQLHHTNTSTQLSLLALLFFSLNILCLPMLLFSLSHSWAPGDPHHNNPSSFHGLQLLFLQAVSAFCHILLAFWAAQAPLMLLGCIMLCASETSSESPRRVLSGAAPSGSRVGVLTQQNKAHPTKS